MRLNLWEEFVKVWHLQMAKMSLNMTRKFKITDFLLGFGFRSRRLFCRYCYVTWVYRFSYMYVKRSLRALRWISIGGAVEPFCHTYFWNTYSDVFRPGFLSNMWSLGQIEHCMAELQQHLFPWRDIEIWQDATDTPSHENSRSSQFNITKAFRLNWPKYYVDVIKSLGGVSYRVKHVTSCCQQVALLL